MKWQEALARIESPQFAAYLNVVSSERAFFRAVAREPVVLDLYGQLQGSGELREEILGRISDLANQKIDMNYENPHDTALATLLWLTCYASPDFLELACLYTSSAPNCWYAHKLANRILVPTTVQSVDLQVENNDNPSPLNHSSAPASTMYMMDYSTKYHLPDKVDLSLESSDSDHHSIGAAS